MAPACPDGACSAQMELSEFHISCIMQNLSGYWTLPDKLARSCMEGCKVSIDTHRILAHLSKLWVLNRLQPALELSVAEGNFAN
jgi:hypothetical protein